MNGLDIHQIAAQMAALELAANNNAQAPQGGFVTPPNQGVQLNPNIQNAPNRAAPVVLYRNDVNNNPVNARTASAALLALRSGQVTDLLANNGK